MLMRRFVLPALISAALASAAMAQTIGTVASTDPVMRGTPEGGATRTLTVGTQLSAGETITTDANGRGQILFRDQSTLAVGPNTTVILDNFVFDPNSGDGQLGLQLTEGVLRFIGGTLSEDSPATITTPGATIGIRGSTGLIAHLNGATFSVYMSGAQMCYGGQGGAQTCTSQPGGILSADGYSEFDQAVLLTILSSLVDVEFTTEDGTAIPAELLPEVADYSRFQTTGAFSDDFSIDDLFNLLTGALPQDDPIVIVPVIPCPTYPYSCGT